MGKKLIIKGTDFSQNALNVLTWQYEGNSLTNKAFGIGPSSMQSNNFWGYGPKLNSAVSGINYVKLITNSNSVTRNYNIGKNYVLIKLKVGSEVSTNDIITTFSFTSEDIEQGYKIIQISPVSLNEDETIAFGIFDKQNQNLYANPFDNRCYLPVSTEYPSSSGEYTIIVTGDSSIVVLGTESVFAGIWLGTKE